MAIGRQAAARRYGVHVRVVAQVAGPGMQSPHQRDPAADEPWVQSQCLSGLGRGLQEQGIKGLLVAAGQPAEGLREGEGAQEGRDRQQHMRLAFQPLLGLVIVAPGAMPVLTRVVARMLVAAWRTLGHLPAQTLRATRLNVLHGPPVRGWHLGTDLRAVVGAMAAEDVRARA